MTSSAVETITPALTAQGLQVQGTRGGRRVQITDPADLHVMPGEAVAIVGESGSGKSLTVKAMLDLLPPGVESAGLVHIGSKRLDTLSATERHALRGQQIALVMQDPFTMLNPLERCGDLITAALRAPGGGRLGSVARREEAVRRLLEVGIDDPKVADRYPFELSGGMRQRIGIAAAIAENPKVLIADEPTTALDVTTQREILMLLSRLRKTHELGLILVTHDLRVATSVCERIYVMYAGSIVETSSSSDFVAGPRHPYSATLLNADPPIDRRVRRLPSIPGSVPQPGERPHGCRFAPRCAYRVDECDKALPPLREVDVNREVRCVRAGELVEQLRIRSAAAGVDAPSHVAEAVPIIRTRAARREYGDKVALTGVDIDVFLGESVGLVGESGSGKTTLARLMVGLTRPTSGEVLVGGVDLARRRIPRRDWTVVRSTAQMAFQDPYSTLNPARTIGATLRESLRLASNADVERRLGESLERVGLSARDADRKPSQLSGGERQRVAIARALARSPKVVVCDEVVSALDVSVQAHILNLLADLREELGLTYVFITHDLAVVRQITDRLYVLKDGSVVESGPTSDVLDAPSHPYTQSLLASIPHYGGSPFTSPSPPAFDVIPPHTEGTRS